MKGTSSERGVQSILISPLLFAWFTFSPDTIASLAAPIGGASVESAGTIPTFAERVISIIPANPFKAAAEGEVLPLVIFSILFGLAVRRIAPMIESGLVPELLLNSKFRGAGPVGS